MEILTRDNQDKGIQIHFDYLSFTFPMDVEDGEDLYQAFEKYKQDICNHFWTDYDAFGDIKQYKQDGYDNQITLGQNIRIRFGGESTKMKKMLDVDNNIKSDERYTSCMVELKGQGCREIEFLSGGRINYKEMFKYFLFELGGRCTRLDIAIDDMEGKIITLAEILDMTRKKHYVSSFRVNQNPPKLNEALVVDDINQTNGCSIVWGKSNGPHKSDRELMIYDKKAERQFHHDDDVETNYYVRYEMRFRNELADNIAYTLCTSDVINLEDYDIGYFAKNELYRMLKFKIPYRNGKKTKIDNVSMWDDNPKWLKFLDYVEGVKFTQRTKMESTIEIKKAWNIKNITKQEIIFDIADSDVSTLDNWVDSDIKKVYEELEHKLAWFDNHHISKKELEEINNYRRRNYGYTCKLVKQEDLEEYKENLIKRMNELKEKYLLPF